MLSSLMFLLELLGLLQSYPKIYKPDDTLVITTDDYLKCLSSTTVTDSLLDQLDLV